MEIAGAGVTDAEVAGVEGAGVEEVVGIEVARVVGAGVDLAGAEGAAVGALETGSGVEAVMPTCRICRDVKK